VFWEGTVSDWATFSTDEERATDEAVKKTADKLVDAILTNW
jgi:dihydrodipicolinate synthase/N-acetylneuraminate lyase